MTRKSIAALLVLIAAARAEAVVEPSPLFGDHCVLQREKSVPVWGTADAGEKVTVDFQGQQRQTTTAHDRRWRIDLKDLDAGGPFEMTIAGDGGAPVTVKDVLVGEVWVCSGQSNMERQIGPRGGQSPLDDWEKEVAAADYPHVRMFFERKKTADEPQKDLAGEWRVCSPRTAREFSAVGYFFGADLNRHLDVPVGLVFNAVGGTPAEAWTSRDALAADPALKGILDLQERQVAAYPAEVAKYKAGEAGLRATYEAAVAAARAAGTKAPPRPPVPPRDPATSQNRPANLYNGLIAPLAPYAIRGVIWYQGESNAGREAQYRVLFPALIADWRRAWGGEPFPFLFVQLPSYHGIKPELRDAQLATLRHTPMTGMAVTTDLNDTDELHPIHKRPVGERLALAARGMVYGEKVEYSGPIFASAAPAGEKLVVSFTHAGGGLVAKGGPVRGFTVAGEDGKFVPATATVEGETVVVASPEVPRPTACRFGWSNVVDTNLYNDAGLPASPFRSDGE